MESAAMMSIFGQIDTFELGHGMIVESELPESNLKIASFPQACCLMVKCGLKVEIIITKMDFCH